MEFMKIKKPPGWRGLQGDNLWTKAGKFGVSYLCSWCGTNRLGLGNVEYNHKKGCPVVGKKRANRLEELKAELVKAQAAVDALEGLIRVASQEALEWEGTT